MRILACTPSVRLWPRTPCPMVQGRVETVRRFSRSKMHWVSSTLAEAAAASTGFFRIQRDWDWVSLIKSSPQDAALIDDRAGRMADRKSVGVGKECVSTCRSRWSTEHKKKNHKRP